MDPADLHAHFCLGMVYLGQGKRDDGVREMENSLQVSGSPMDKAALGWVYGVAGRKDKALQVLKELQVESGKGFFPPYLLAEVYSGLGEVRQTFALLKKALEIHDTHLIFLPMDPMFENLRAEPEFKSLLEALHFAKSPREIAGFAY
jgi:tetratricopeptide (TPR) repeat protein